MSIRLNRVLLFSQRFVSEQYLDPNNYYAAQYAAPYDDPNINNPFKTSSRDSLSTDDAALRLEYDAML